MTSVPTFLSPGEAAELLTSKGVAASEATVRRWAKAGRIPAIRLPFGRLKIRVEDVEALLEPTAGAA
jgi:excisionase family DNA binding protein